MYSAASNAINYTLVVPAGMGGPDKGWYGVGQGEGMSGANMMVSPLSPSARDTRHEAHLVSFSQGRLGKCRRKHHDVAAQRLGPLDAHLVPRACIGLHA